MRHVFLDCGAVGRLLQFRHEVTHSIRSLQRLYARLGAAAADASSFLARALAAATSFQASDEQWSALVALVGASIPECDAPTGRERQLKRITDSPRQS